MKKEYLNFEINYDQVGIFLNIFFHIITNLKNVKTVHDSYFSMVHALDNMKYSHMNEIKHKDNESVIIDIPLPRDWLGFFSNCEKLYKSNFILALNALFEIFFNDKPYVELDVYDIEPRIVFNMDKIVNNDDYDFMFHSLCVTIQLIKSKRYLDINIEPFKYKFLEIIKNNLVDYFHPYEIDEILSHNDKIKNIISRKQHITGFIFIDHSVLSDVFQYYIYKFLCELKNYDFTLTIDDIENTKGIILLDGYNKMNNFKFSQKYTFNILNLYKDLVLDEIKYIAKKEPQFLFSTVLLHNYKSSKILTFLAVMKILFNKYGFYTKEIINDSKPLAYYIHEFFSKHNIFFDNIRSEELDENILKAFKINFVSIDKYTSIPLNMFLTNEGFNTFINHIVQEFGEMGIKKLIYNGIDQITIKSFIL